MTYITETINTEQKQNSSNSGKNTMNHPTEEINNLALQSSDNWRDMVNINVDDLSNELADQPRHFSYYSSIHAYANHLHEVAANELRELEGEVEREVRRVFGAQDKKLTVKQVETQVALNDRVKAKKKELAEAKLKRDLTKVAVDAFGSKLKAMIALSHLRKAEMSNLEPTIREDRRNDFVRSKTMGKR
jgi:BMFP domain-containing protein YqiC